MGKKAQKARQKKREQLAEKAVKEANQIETDVSELAGDGQDAGPLFPTPTCKHLKQVNTIVFPKLEPADLKQCELCTSAGGGRVKHMSKHAKKLAKRNGVQTKTPLDQLWVCIQCGKTHCRPSNDLHSLQHFAEYNKHSLILNVKTHELYCFGCRETIPVDAEHPAFESIRQVIKQIIVITNGPGEVADSEIEGLENDPAPAKPVVKYSSLSSFSGVKGLNNLGNTCFYNSIVQNLVQTIPLRERFVVRRDGSAPPVIAEGPTTAALHDLMVHMWTGSEKTFSPSNLLNQIGRQYAQFRKRHQQDSHELLRCLLDLVSTEERKVLDVIKKAASSITLSQVQSSPQPDSVEATKQDTAVIIPASDPPPTLETTSTSVQSPDTAESEPSTIETVVPDSTSSGHSSSSVAEHTSDESAESGAVLPSPDPETSSNSSPISNPPVLEATDAPEESTSSTTTPLAPEPEPPKLSSPVSSQATTPSEKALAKMERTKQVLREEGIETIFGGELESRLTCHVCHTRRTVIEPFMDLSLSIPMASERFMHQLSAASGGKKGSNKKGSAKGKEPEYPMRDDEKRKRSDIFKGQQQKVLQELASSSEPVPEVASEPLVASAPSVEPPSTTSAEPANVVESQTDQSSPVDSQTPGAAEPSAVSSDTPSIESNQSTSVDPSEPVALATSPDNAEPSRSQEAESSVQPPGDVSSETALEEDDEKEDIEIDTRVVEGPTEVHDARRVAQPPKSGSLESCIYTFTEAELLDQTNAFGCYNCTKQAWLEKGKDIAELVWQYGSDEEKKELITRSVDPKAPSIPLLKRRATKQFLINKQPRVLTLHLKRFWQISATKFAKLDASISFPVTLDLNAYTTEKQDVPPGKKYVYKLYGISSHSGGIGGGHYVAYTRRRPSGAALEDEQIDQDWFYFSDTHVQSVSLKNVLSQEAYVLFYERVLEDL